MRWYKNFRILTCDTDEDIVKVYQQTKILADSLFLLPKDLDQDELRKHTIERFEDFYRVLGSKRFTSHFGNICKIVPKEQVDLYECFCALCDKVEAETGRDLVESLTQQEVINLLNGMSTILVAAHFDTEVIERLLAKCLAREELRAVRYTKITDHAVRIEKLRIDKREFYDALCEETLERLAEADLADLK